ncbi:hypothetical protein RSO01_69950 [Reyranella soli]|uniref:Uncharacterized protein n=1 Tax=Reyranella soli TaxID=1230389 RepID=A0A512NLN6_9HYPH|nr:hypothetical protein RSO01_69950 [Reyranella soli]
MLEALTNGIDAQIALLHWALPEMSGLELLGALRERGVRTAGLVPQKSQSDEVAIGTMHMIGSTVARCRPAAIDLTSRQYTARVVEEGRYLAGMSRSSRTNANQAAREPYYSLRSPHGNEVARRQLDDDVAEAAADAWWVGAAIGGTTAALTVL